MGLLRRLAALFRRDAMDRELDEELQFHLEMKSRESGDRFAAYRAVGNSLLLRERGRDAWGWRWLDELAQDVRYALRGMRRSKGFAFAAVLTLALAIGANCLVFSVADATLFRPFAFRDPDRLVYLWSSNSQYPRMYSSGGNYRDWRAQNNVFEDLGAYGCCAALDLPEGSYAERIEGIRASASFFRLAGIQAELGRTFLPEEELSGHSPVILLSDHLWRSRFAAKPNIIGSTISGATYDDRHTVFTIVGVLPPELEQTMHFLDFCTPLLRDDADAKTWAGGALSVVGRLKPGVSIPAAQASVQALVDRLRPSHRQAYPDMGVTVVSYHDELTRNSRPQTLLLLAAVGMVLMIACINVANLMLARRAERLKELSIRSAIGAGRRRLFRQLLTESLALGLFGGAAGVALAYTSIRAVRAALPVGTLRRDTVAVNSHVLLITLLLSIAAAILFGLLPAWRSSKARIEPGLFGLLQGGHERTFWRGALIVSEIALVLILVTGAGLMVNSLVRLTSRDLGFDRRDLLVVETSLPFNKYRDPDSRMPVEQEILNRMRSLPGVRSAAIVDSHPLGGGNELYLRRYPDDAWQLASSLSVTPEYFEVMGIPLRSGRGFTSQDGLNTPNVAIVDEIAARKLWPNEDPAGKTIQLRCGRNLVVAFQVVGVAANIVGSQLNAAPQPYVYFSQAQESNLAIVSIVMRAANPAPPLPAIRTELAAIDPALVVGSSGNMQFFVDAQLAQPRFLTLVLVIFAALALGLTITGIVGVIAYLVRARTYEFGVRIALGAAPGEVLALICGYGGKLAALGIVIGLGGALALTRLLVSYLYGVKRADPATLTGVVVLVLFAAMLACYLPARRAMRTDPARALRHD